MAKSSPEEAVGAKEEAKQAKGLQGGGHPFDFLVSGPRTLSSLTWRDLIHSSWKDPNYKRMAVACFIQAAYLLELDRQNKCTGEEALAPKWWKPFKYKLTQTLVDERDGSIYGAVLEWDHAAALSGFIIAKPSGAPRAVFALRGTLLTGPTARRDIEDDLRFLAWESLKGSIRFAGIIAALRPLIERFGSSSVYLAGHSLGAGFSLQAGKALAKEGAFLECHLFNPPSVSLATALKTIGEKAGRMLKRAMETTPGGILGPGFAILTNDFLARKQPTEFTKSLHLYVNNSDYICCYYTDRSGAAVAGISGEASLGKDDAFSEAAGKLFVTSKGPKKFLEAHGLQQWWSSDTELQIAIRHSKLLDRQLRSFYDASSEPR